MLEQMSASWLRGILRITLIRTLGCPYFEVDNSVLGVFKYCAVNTSAKVYPGL